MNRTWRDVFLLVLLVLLIRIPFLNQAVGGDDPYYLAAAEHAQVDPWHPNHTSYIFQGKEVTFRGYPHPPGNAWVLAGLLALFGDIREVPFHAVYIVFSLMAVLSVYALGRRLCERPMMAALLFLAVPVFVVNGNTLESDIPFVSFWLAGFAAYVWEWRVLSAIALAGAGFISPQAFVAVPILLLYDRKGLRSWLPALAPLLALVGWQCFEKLSTGQFPAEVTAGYLSSYGYNSVAAKLRNAVALFIHSWFLIFPLLVPFALWRGWQKRQWFLLGWVGLFLGAAMVLFYAGAARYVLPIAAPLALLAADLLPGAILAAAGLQLALSLALASVNYQQWNANRDFVEALPATGRMWANAEWGLRFYAESRGALPVRERQWIPAGDVVVASDLAYPVDFNHAGRTLVKLASREVVSTIPLRLIGLYSHAGFATDAKGFLPFGVGSSPIDRLHAEILVEKKPVKAWLEMNAPEFEDQAVSGTYRLEENRYRWTSGSAAFLLKPADRPVKLEAEFYLPEAAKARHIELLLGSKTVAAMDCPGAGTYTLVSNELQSVSDSSAQVTLQVDKTFSVTGDNRKLGVILTGIGFR